ncbi:MAG: acetyl-CoA carboxylase biotin carboxyl carrier protein subunit [Planctomycetaceae bacterium]|nr:acetyl-CoA carboxylase biotin carboxyl carrier protein subunit [Planctomycetaceae bacterium]
MKKLRITVGKKTYDVTVEVLSDDTPSGVRAAPATVGAVPSVAASTPTPTAATPPGAAAPGAVVSPMAGTVKTVEVKEGDEVAAGDVLIVLEAMKMENKISAPKAGVVKSVAVTEGQGVQDGQELVVIE